MSWKLYIIVGSLVVIIVLLGYVLYLGCSQGWMSSGICAFVRLSQNNLEVTSTAVIDPSKRETNCLGNYFIRKDRPLTDFTGVEQKYDFALLKDRATQKGYQAVFEYMLVDEIRLDAYLEEFEMKTPLREGDVVTQGVMRLHIKDGWVERSAPSLRVTHQVSKGETYEVVLDYQSIYGEADPPLQLWVEQKGRCDLEDNYLKKQVKQLLDDVGIESQWIEGAEVHINSQGRGAGARF